MHSSLIRPLHQDGLVGRLVALQLCGPRGLVAHEALLALEHQHGTVGQVEVVPGVQNTIRLTLLLQRV